MPDSKQSELRIAFIKTYPRALRLLVQGWGELRQHAEIKNESVRQHLPFKHFQQLLTHLYLSAAALDYNDLAQFIQRMLQRLELITDEQLVTDIDSLMNQIIGFAQSPNDPMLVATPNSPDMLAYQQVEQLTLEVEQDVLNETLEDMGIVLEHDIIIAIIDDRAVSYSMQKLLESFNFRVQVFNSIGEFIDRDKDQYAHLTPHLILLDIVMPDVTEQEVFAFAETMRNQTIKVICLSVKAFSNVATFFKVLENFTPDIFLLDLSMPDISGLEVAKVLRQQSKYDFIPIVFLTADESESTKIEILNAGADDVILKGTPVRMVFQHITTRTIRGQHIRYLTSRDSLTGVLNHGQIMDACATAFTLFNRNLSNFVVVLIDLDNFKSVNDEFGHPIGDKVLFGIGQLLHRSLRQSDLVGRYGGEEFVLLLHDTDSRAVEDKIESIRVAFSELEFKSETKKFNVTFSAGIADAKHYQNITQLICAADNALYQAKRSGRNRLINADELNFEPDTNLI